MALDTSLMCLDDDNNNGSLQGEEKPSLRDGEEGQNQRPLFKENSL